MHVGYVLKQYPRLSETFILTELLALETHEVATTVFSLRPSTEGRFHPEVSQRKGDVEYLPQIGRGSVQAAFEAASRFENANLVAALGFVDLLPVERRTTTLVQGLVLAGRASVLGIDHLHSHFLTVASHVAHIAHLMSGIPYSVTAHAKDIYRHSVDWRVGRAVTDAADAVVTVCDANVAHLEQHLPGTRVERIYNGLNAAASQPPTRRGTPLLLGVGRLVEKKGFDVLIDVTERLVARGAPVQTVIIGDGELRADLEAQVRGLGLGDVVSFAGACAAPEVAMWMQQARVMVAPCRVGTDGNQDALPTVLLEALRAGLPTVTTPVGGIPEIIEDGREGIIVPSNDVAATTNAVERIISDETLWAEMSRRGPVKLAERFDRDTTIHELIALFEKQPALASAR